MKYQTWSQSYESNRRNYLSLEQGTKIFIIKKSMFVLNGLSCRIQLAQRCPIGFPQ